jgi:hypothetical protein
MKINKLLIIVIVLALSIFTSCSVIVNKPKDDIKEENFIEENPSKEISVEFTNDIPTAWNLNMSSYEVNVPYQVPEFTPNVKDYNVNEDLSNLFNAGQYTGFTDEQINAIYNDGFVIMEPSFSALKLHQLYEWPIYKRSPIFITVDSALHLYHIYYDKSLQYVEVAVLYDKLDSLSKNLLLESIKAYISPDNSELKEELKFVSAYFLTACKLLETNINSINVPPEISAIADKEMQLIAVASDFTESPLLGKDLDYSQFTVRGHYTGNVKLEKYFKAMMWYGLCGFPVFDEDSETQALDIESVTKGMIITCLALKNQDNFNEWENIYSITALYAGMSDDLGIFEYRDLIANVYGKDPELDWFKDSSYYPKLLEEALKLPEPKIVPNINSEFSDLKLSAGKQFRFMGQRYSYDAEIMQNLMEPILRPVPSGLDVVAGFGSIRAEELLDLYYHPKEAWGGYEMALNFMREKNKAITEDEWKSDLYKGWLWSIKTSSKSFEDVEGMPKFMRSRKWTDKNIHTALGSYAELKHDSILYVKQPVAEMGGGPDFSIPLNYVEPNVEVYAKLKWLAEYTKKQLEMRNMLEGSSGQVLDEIIEIQNMLLNVSIKELTNQNITEEENNVLYRYGGQIDYVIQRLNYNLVNVGIGTEKDITSALIADVATIAPNNFYPHGTYLEVGNGLPLEIYAVCETNGKLYLAKGALFNYYEFLSDKRLTDEEWQEMIGIKRTKWIFSDENKQYVQDDGTMNIDENTDYFEEVEIQRPYTDYVSKPKWTNSFITPGENYVTVSDEMEFEWWK